MAISSREAAAAIIQQLKSDLEQYILGQDALLIEVLTCLLSNGHLLITGAPGLAKTTLVRVLSQLSGLDYGRVQFTPDLLPSDITGSEVLSIDPETGKRQFEFIKGPIFTHLLLADEINRASPRTQSALLEAMQERAVTVGGKRLPLAKPFMVFATQNPFESEGTFVLPEAQLDRFLFHSLIDYPSAEAERRIFAEHAHNRLIGESEQKLPKPLGRETLLELNEFVKSTAVPEPLIQVISELVRATRPQDETCPDVLRKLLVFGAGTRAGIALTSAAKAHALIKGREAVRWEDIKRVALPVLRHRLRLNVMAMRDQWTEDRVVNTVVDKITAKYSGVLEG